MKEVRRSLVAHSQCPTAANDGFSIAAEAAPVRVVRERPAPVVVQDSALVLVETKRDLRTLEVPMDTGPKTPV